MRWTPSLLVAVAILGMARCGGGDDHKNPTGCDSGDMSVSDWPVRVGAWWSYQRTTRDVGYAEVDTYTVRVVKHVSVLGGHSAYLFVEEPSGETDWFTIIDGEVRNYDMLPAAGLPYLVFMKDPIREGTTWTYNIGDGGPSYQARITQTCVSVQVPAGNLQGCIRMEVRPYMTMHFRPDIGMIEGASGDEESGTADRLISYQIPQ